MTDQPNDRIRYDVKADCDGKRLEAFLDGRLSDEGRESLLKHLDSCVACCEQLQSLAASETEWQKLPELLPGSVSSLKCQGADNDGAVSLDFLAPTDDPGMLGRIGPYEIMGVIGQGGMGIVFKGFDRPLNRTVAIKVLAPQLAINGVARRRFAREAQAAAAVVHQHVIAIHGVEAHDNLPYLVMPYLPGQSLQQRIDQNGPLAVAEVLRVGMQTAAGLAAAHAQGLVHRDVKPANILLEKGIERVVITDFGLARAADDASLTRSGVIAGTPHYMAPEQARGEALDHRADLFSLGASMYAMCTGEPPFRGRTALGVLRRVTDEEPHPIRDINPEIPDWLCEIVDKLLEKRPEDRFESARAVADLLAAHLAHLQHPATHPKPPRLREQAILKRRQRRQIAPIAFAVALIALFLSLAAGSLALRAPGRSEHTTSDAESNVWEHPDSVVRQIPSTPGQDGTFSSRRHRQYWDYWMEQCHRHAADWEIFLVPLQSSDSSIERGSESEASPAVRLKHLPEPIFGHVERPSQVDYQDQIGAVYLWVDSKDRPAVIGTVLANADDGRRRLSHLFASLSTESLAASWRGQELWNPGPGIEWLPLSDGPDPEAAPDRLGVQIRSVALRFGGVSVDREQRIWVLNIVPDPVYEWQVAESGATTFGAAFAICEERDPEIILLIELHQDNGKHDWSCAFAPFSNREVRATLDGEEVWQVGPRPSPVPETSPRWVISGVEYLPEPTDLIEDVGP